MRIAVLSGKGGTGKTLVSVNLAAAAKAAFYIDCDVEEPNGHLFFKPEKVREKEVAVAIPVVDEQLCTGCRRCVDFCGFNALAFVGEKVKVFEDICHSCGGCALVCPVNAIGEKQRAVGTVSRGESGSVGVLGGIMNPGEASGMPLIKQLMRDSFASPGYLTFIDCPPGSGCLVMESIHDADYCVMVAEPTTFGASNLQSVYELVKLFGLPHGVVLNKCLDGENPSEQFCLDKGIEILGRITFDSELGKITSDGKIAVRESEAYARLFGALLQTIIRDVRHETTVNPQRKRRHG